MGIFDFILRNLSDETLDDLEEKIRNRVDSLDDNPKKQVKLDLHRIDVVNEIASRSSGKLPKSEHGWYLPEDDD